MGFSRRLADEVGALHAELAAIRALRQRSAIGPSLPPQAKAGGSPMTEVDTELQGQLQVLAAAVARAETVAVSSTGRAVRSELAGALLAGLLIGHLLSSP